MSRGKKVFTPQDKDDIRARLKSECLSSWVLRGYKDTVIGELCKKTEISTGTFYNLYSSKENLFLDVLRDLQSSISQLFLKQVSNDSTKLGFANAIIQFYNEFESKPFLHDTNSSDFVLFSDKLDEAIKEKINIDVSELFVTAINHSQLKLKVSMEMAFSIFCMLIFGVTLKSTGANRCNYRVATQFMAEQLVNCIFK